MATKLTDEQVKQIVEMYQAGKLQVQIAKELGVSQPTIHYQLKKLGLTKVRKAESVLEDTREDVTNTLLS